MLNVTRYCLVCFRCACTSGQISHDKLHCSNADVFLIFSKRTEIRSLHLEPGNTSPLFKAIPGLGNAFALDLDYGEKKIYYTDISDHSINSVFLNGTGKAVILKGLLLNTLSFYFTCDEHFAYQSSLSFFNSEHY